MKELKEKKMLSGKIHYFFKPYTYLEQILFFIVPSILTFDFDLILGSFLAFGGPNGLLFKVRGRVQKLFWGLLM